MMLTEAFYWDLNDATRAWSKRFFDQVKKMPNACRPALFIDDALSEGDGKGRHRRYRTGIAAMRATPIMIFST